MCPPCLIAASYRAQYLAIVVLHAMQITELRTYRIPSGPDVQATVLRHLSDAASDFDASALVVEPGTPCAEVAHETCLAVRQMTLEEAKRLLLEGRGPQNHQRLFDTIVARYPTLARFVRLLPGTLRVAASERWRTNALIAAALGFAAVRFMDAPTAEQPRSPPLRQV